MSLQHDAPFSANGSHGPVCAGQTQPRDEILDALGLLEEGGDHDAGRLEAQPTNDSKKTAPADARPEIKRDANGQFAAGTAPGPGNPYNRQVARIKRLLLSTVSDERILRIGNKLGELAEQGNVAAARVLLGYVLPRNVEPDRVAQDEWAKLKETAPMMAEISAIMDSPDPELPLTLMRELRPINTRKQWRPIVGALHATPKEWERAMAEPNPLDGGAMMTEIGTRHMQGRAKPKAERRKKKRRR